jgi:hypothetical protein
MYAVLFLLMKARIPGSPIQEGSAVSDIQELIALD